MARLLLNLARFLFAIVIGISLPISVTLSALLLANYSNYKYILSAMIFSILYFVCYFFVLLYSIVGRNAIFPNIFKDVELLIITRLSDMAGLSGSELDKTQRKMIKEVYWSFLDNDVSLKIRMLAVYVNGFLVTSCLDTITMSLMCLILIFLVSISYLEPHLSYSFFGFAFIELGILFVISKLVYPLLIRRHLRLVGNQLDFIEANYRTAFTDRLAIALSAKNRVKLEDDTNDDGKSIMNKESSLKKIGGCENPARRGDVIFVHGLDGDWETTWAVVDEPSRYWPKWLSEDLTGVGVWSLDYPAASLAWRGNAMPLYDRAINILTLLEVEGIGERPLVFICHSLGGLLVKEMIHQAESIPLAQRDSVTHNIKGLVFLSTPHSGADIANWVEYAGSMLKAMKVNVSVEELQKNNSSLRQLNTWFRNHFADLGLKAQVYFEKIPTKLIAIPPFNKIVVDESSADPGIPAIIPIPIDADHYSIVRPTSKDTLVYKSVLVFVRQVLK